jgi:hypothetical protein
MIERLQRRALRENRLDDANLDVIKSVSKPTNARPSRSWIFMAASSCTRSMPRSPS